MRMLYRWLLLLYPASFRHEFAEEMVVVFADASAAAERCAWHERLVFTAREIAGVVRGAFEEHVITAFGRPPAQRRLQMSSPRLRFRFPISAIAFMVATLGLVLTAIRMARIASDVASKRAIVYGAHGLFYVAGRPSFLQTFGFAFVITMVCAVVALLVMHALHQSGTDRLADAQTWPIQK